MKNTLLKGLLFASVVLGGLTAANVTAHASEEDGVWQARTVEQIKADISGNQYLVKWGDTLSGISAATNITVDKLQQLNGIQDINLIYAGNTLTLEFDGNTVIVKDQNGIVQDEQVVQESDKNVANAPIGQEAPVTTPSQQDDSYTVNSTTPEASTVSDDTNSASNTNTSSPGAATTTPSDTTTDGTDSSNPSNNGGNNGSSNTNNDSDDSTSPSDNSGNNNNDNNGNVTPTPVAQPVTVSYVDENGNSIVPSTTLTGGIGEVVTAQAKQVDGYTLTSAATLSFTISDQAQNGTFTYKKDDVQPTEKWTVWFTGDTDHSKDIALGSKLFDTREAAREFIDGYADKVAIDFGITAKDYGVNSWSE